MAKAAAEGTAEEEEATAAVLWAAESLANVNIELGEYSKAITLYEVVVVGLTKRFGRGHRDVLWAKECLEWCIEKGGRPSAGGAASASAAASSSVPAPVKLRVPLTADRPKFRVSAVPKIAFG